MSHTTTLKALVFRDVDAMRAAVADLVQKGIKCRLVENEQPRMYYAAQHGKCAYVLKLDDGRYDVGFDKQPDGTFLPVFDEWQGYVANALGATGVDCNTAEERAMKAIGQFSQSYATHAAINQAVMQGYSVDSVETDEQGNVHLMLAVA
jgi:hypothetical protein